MEGEQGAHLYTLREVRSPGGQGTWGILGCWRGVKGAPGAQGKRLVSPLALNPALKPGFYICAWTRRTTSDTSLSQARQEH